MPKIDKCIYCHEVKPLSREDCLPRGLGKFMGDSYLDNKICITCNNGFQIFEGPFLQNSPIGLIRHLLGIEGRSKHKLHNPFQEGSYGTAPIELMALSPEKDYEIILEPDRGTNHGREARQIIFRDTQGKTHNVLITDKMKTSDDLRKELKRRDLQDAHPFRFFFSEEEYEWMLSLIKPLFPTINFGKITKAKEGQVFDCTFTSEVEQFVYRCIAKIAFHYFLKQYDSIFTGFEEEFALIKEFICHGGSHENFVSFIRIDKPEPCERIGHQIIVSFNEGLIISEVCIFKGVFTPPLLWRVTIGDSPLKGIVILSKGNNYWYYENGKQNAFDGEVKEIHFPYLLRNKIS
jgi:hypothetical protein